MQAQEDGNFVPSSLLNYKQSGIVVRKEEKPSLNYRTAQRMNVESESFASTLKKAAGIIFNKVSCSVTVPKMSFKLVEGRWSSNVKWDHQKLGCHFGPM